MKKIVILGATGSIGTQSVDVCIHHPEEFECVGLSCGHNITLLKQLLATISVRYVCVGDESALDTLKAEYPHITFLSGEAGLKTLVSLEEVDIVVNGISGFAGMRPSIWSIEAHKDLALANKETLVVGGALITKLVKENHVRLLPVDSEHSAIFQCLNGEHHDEIKRLIITASGGAFRDKTREELTNVTKEDALKHPNWSMGAYITIDSASMFNKGLEIIEAKWLFDLDFDQISVVMHPQSIIHSMIEFKDGAVMAQMGTPDMRLPIQYALTYPNRMVIGDSEPLDLLKVGSLTFRELDEKRFPALRIAIEVGKAQKTYPAVFNAAKEAATRLFLNDAIPFLGIEAAVKDALKAHQPIDNPTLEDLLEADRWTRDYVVMRQKGGHYANID